MLAVFAFFLLIGYALRVRQPTRAIIICSIIVLVGVAVLSVMINQMAHGDPFPYHGDSRGLVQNACGIFGSDPALSLGDIWDLYGVRYSAYTVLLVGSALHVSDIGVLAGAVLVEACLWSMFIGRIVEQYRSDFGMDLNSNVVIIISLGVFAAATFYVQTAHRDGLVALSFMFLVLHMLSGTGRNYGSTAIAALCFLYIALSRPQLAVSFLVAVTLVSFLFPLLRRSRHGSLLLMAGVLFSILLLPFLVYPDYVRSIFANYLLPHGSAALAELDLSRTDVLSIYRSGSDGEVGRYLQDRLIHRGPSVLYEPAPMRYLLWAVTGIVGTENALVTGARSLSSVFVYIVIAVFSARLIKGDKTIPEEARRVFWAVGIVFILMASVYVIKYGGFNFRVALPMWTALLIVIPYFGPLGWKDRYLSVMAGSLMVILGSLYTLLKPFDWLFSYI